MHYAVYFLGPFVLGVMGAHLLRQRYRIFVVGLASYLAAWILCQTVASIALAVLPLTERSLGFALIAALAGATFEESVRYIVFQRVPAFRDNRTWGSSMTYALGHNGMEVLLAGLTMLLIALVLRYKPGVISDAATLRDCQAAMASSGGAKFLTAIERLALGLLVQTCFSGIVILAVATHRVRWLWVAMGWHMLHNIVAYNLHRVSDHWLLEKAWLLVVTIGYSYLAVRIYRLLQSRPAVHSSTPSAGAAPMILPGRAL